LNSFPPAGSKFDAVLILRVPLILTNLVLPGGLISTEIGKASVWCILTVFVAPTSSSRNIVPLTVTNPPPTKGLGTALVHDSPSETGFDGSSVLTRHMASGSTNFRPPILLGGLLTLRVSPKVVWLYLSTLSPVPPGFPYSWKSCISFEIWALPSAP